MQFLSPLRVFGWLWLLPSLLFAQTTDIQSSMTLGTCLFDASVQSVRPTSHLFYLTENDRFDGPIDSSFCAEFLQNDNGSYYLNLAGFDYDRPLFVRQLLPDVFPPSLAPYTNYLLNQFFWFDDLELDTATVATDSLFGGFRLGYQFMDEVTGVSDNRETVLEFGGPLLSPYPEETGNFCFYTERFNSQQLTYLVAVFRLHPAGPDPRLTPYSLGLSDSQPGEAAVDFFEIFDFSGGNGPFESEVLSAVRTVEPGGNWPYYLPQFTDFLPGPDNVRFTEVTLSPNRSTPQDLVLQNTLPAALHQPPFTAIRPGLVAGQDSLRHNLTVEYPDDPFFNACFYFIVENRVAPFVNLRFHDADLEFGNNNTCFIFSPGSSMTIAANATVTYGARGVGLLATKRDTRINLETNSALSINVKWQLAQRPDTPEDDDTHVYLEEGSLLSFGPASSLERSHPDGSGYLYLHMNGGAADLSELSARERALIRFVYPDQPVPAPPDALSVFPNPTSGELLLQFPTGYAESTAALVLYDVLGRPCWTAARLQLPSAGNLPLQLPGHLASGVYTLRVDFGNRAVISRVVLSR